MYPIASRRRNKIALRRLVCAVSFAAACFVTVSATAMQMQLPSGNTTQMRSNVSSGAVDIPQTNLTPIAPPAVAPPSNGIGQFDPYGTTPSAQFGGGTAPPISGPGSSFGSAPNFGTAPNYGSPPSPGFGSGPSVGSGLSSGLPASSAVIGPPTASSSLAPGAAFGSAGQIAPSPPGGSLLGRIFSRPASAPVSSGFGPPSYSGPTYGAYDPPMYGAPGYGAPSFGAPGFGAPGVGAPSLGAPSLGAPTADAVYGNGPTFGAPAESQFPSSVYPSSTPSVLFPGGLVDGGVFSSEGYVGTIGYETYRLFQGPRLSHEFVSGGSKPTDLQINNIDSSLVFAFPNFLYGARPLFVIPSFSLHLWDGPDGSTGADLPPSAYSAFLDVGWESDPNQMFSTEMGVRIGAFTDFDTFESQSWRVLGKALFNFRMTPASTLKGGVYYLDRNSIKLVPAGGLLWHPNPYTKVDLFFPQPKFSRYCRTVGTRDVWWYLAGDYGGGSWTIKRTDTTTDSVDINELRAVFGIEWGESNAIRAGRRSAFFEFGYVFNREIEYRLNPQDNIKPDDGFMIRAGIGY